MWCQVHVVPGDNNISVDCPLNNLDTLYLILSQDESWILEWSFYLIITV